ncbi:gluconokinase [Azoarcus sp. L1K30]|uniref:gluconokinase n=1 Tax=Azoarcus sp. L1K30 TaxID=2820277 RepID=UPI001B837B34|nr:gluconokinase [Azoarcus sp. L1K30]MBR0565957.1 gluconokinase [Azoarcus sp. L1K30]
MVLKVVVMGVAGCGKSSLGKALASAAGWPLIEGDDFHPVENVTKMRLGKPLDDGDRAGWLDALCGELRKYEGGVVLTCSALKKAYRERLRSAVPELRFVHLQLTREEAQRRVEQRGGGHYFNVSLIDSQFDTLESTAGEPGVLGVDATQPLEALTRKIIEWYEEGRA